MHLCGVGGKDQISIQKAKPRGKGIIFRELCDNYVPKKMFLVTIHGTGFKVFGGMLATLLKQSYDLVTRDEVELDTDSSFWSPEPDLKWSGTVIYRPRGL